MPITRSGISGDDLRQRGYHERMCDSETTSAAFQTTVAAPESKVKSLCPPGFCAEISDSRYAHLCAPIVPNATTELYITPVDDHW